MIIPKRKKEKSTTQLLKRAQVVFNAWIRQRDIDKGCISCGSEVTQAGHYLSQGHHGHVRFNEVNVNGQCVRCNCFLHGNLINYRRGLINKYGEQKVMLLESGKNGVKKWSKVELIAIIQTYKN